MKSYKSINGNIIKFDENTISQNIETILSQRFEEGDLEKTLADLHDPFLLADMDKAVARIKLAFSQDEKIMIFGDYDVDGATSTSVLMHFFKKMGAQATYRLPHRIHDGYGLKSYFVDEAKKIGVTLIITVDCGTRDVEIIKYAKSIGVDVIVTDHHAVPEVIPEEAIAIINPKRLDCNYPFKHLSGVGVAFKLMLAVARDFLNEDEYKQYLQETIDIVAIGTVADCMRLVGENRIIVKEGLKQIKNSRSRGIKKLIEDKINYDLDADIFGFTIGPRLNAAGRMDSPYKAVNLILNNGETLDATLKEIEELNERRKYYTKQFLEDALNKVDPKNNILFYVSTEIEHGIIGIVAGNLTQKYFKPSIVLKDEGDHLVGSCRSPEYFSIVEILEKYKDYFVRFGGHKQAAGFTIERSKFGEFRNKIVAELNQMDFTVYKNEIIVDKFISLNEVGFKFLDIINSFKPYGIGNNKPLFVFKKDSSLSYTYLGESKEHIKINNNQGLKIFGFGFGGKINIISKIKILGVIVDINEDFRMGKRGIMLKIIDFIDLDS